MTRETVVTTDKLAEGLRELLGDIRLANCNRCQSLRWDSLRNAQEVLAAHAAEAAQPADARDAARYRWLLAHKDDEVDWPQNLGDRTPENISAAIDSAMAREGE